MQALKVKIIELCQMPNCRKKMNIIMMNKAELYDLHVSEMTPYLLT